MSDENRPPHPATATVQRAPHPATVQRKGAPFGMPKVASPHPATMPCVVVQPKAVQERPAHRATVQPIEALFGVSALRRPHLAAVVQPSSSSSSLSSSSSSSLSSCTTGSSAPSNGETWEMFAGCKRPEWAGPVTIEDHKCRVQSSPLIEANARSVHGIVVPVITKARKGTKPPPPQSGAATGKRVGTDKGHLMGLELGGPDVTANIAPQSNLWQETGGWRDVEKYVRDFALEVMRWDGAKDPEQDLPRPKRGVYFRVNPGSELDAKTAEPASYIITVTVIDIYCTGYSASLPWNYKVLTITPNGVAFPSEIPLEPRKELHHRIKLASHRVTPYNKDHLRSHTIKAMTDRSDKEEKR
ncbi:MAG TPA: hypothetical protein VIV60_19570 [Polyangiaceae bacterium]